MDKMEKAAEVAISPYPLFIVMIGPITFIAAIVLAIKGWMQMSANKYDMNSEEYKNGKFMLICSIPVLIISFSIIMLTG